MDKLSKEEKQKAKQKLALEAKMNKSLIAVPKNTALSMGIAAVEAKGLFKMTDGRWVKVLSPTATEPIKNAVGKLPCRMRITSMFSEGARQDYLTLIDYSESFLDAAKVLDNACETLRECGLAYETLSVDDVMNSVMKNYGIKGSFNIASAVRKKKSFKEMVMKTPESETDGAFNVGGMCSSVYFAMICDNGFSSPLKSMIDADFSFISALDIAPVKGKALIDYKKLLEAHYDRQVASANDGQIVNTSLYVMTVSESEEARKTLEDIIFRLFPAAGVTLSPAFGIQREAEESVMSLGILDSSYMRMLRTTEAALLIP